MQPCSFALLFLLAPLGELAGHLDCLTFQSCENRQCQASAESFSVILNETHVSAVINAWGVMTPLPLTFQNDSALSEDQLVSIQYGDVHKPPYEEFRMEYTPTSKGFLYAFDQPNPTIWLATYADRAAS